MQLSYLPDAENHPLWPDIAALLHPAIRCDEPLLEEGDLVWIAYDGPTIFAAATARPIDEDEALLRLGSGTRFREWMPQLVAAVSAWAAMNGARKLTMRGRRGWARYARDLGWVVLGEDEEGRTMFEKEL